MSKSPKLILFAAGGLVGALILIAVVVLLILGVNTKRQVNTRLSRAQDGSQRRWPTGHRFLSELAHYDGECAGPQLFVVRTISFKLLYSLVILRHARRRP